MKYQSITKLAVAVLTGLTLYNPVFASDDHDHSRNKNRCDVVSLNGTGQLLANGSIVGTEMLTILDTGKQIEVKFTATPLGVLDVDQTTGAISMVASHDFSGTNKRRVNFTTFDDLTIIPFGEDPSCVTNACGLKFKLKLETGSGRYNCGEIVSGLNPDPSALIPFTSYVDPLSGTANGDTVILNSVGKLCKCTGHD